MPSDSASAKPRTAALKVCDEVTLIAGNAYPPPAAPSSIARYCSAVASMVFRILTCASAVRHPIPSALSLPRHRQAMAPESRGRTSARCHADRSFARDREHLKVRAPQCPSCLTGKVRSGCRGPFGERYVMSEAFELGDEASGVAFGVAVGEVVAAEVAVGLAGGEHVPDRADHGVLDGAERTFVAASWFEAPVLGFEVVTLDADGGHGGLFEREVQPLGPVARPAGAALAGRLVVAGAQTGPGREMACGRKARHVGADLADDALRAAVLDARDRAQQLNRQRERADLLLDHAGELLDLLVEEIDMAGSRRSTAGVSVEVSGERLAQRRD